MVNKNRYYIDYKGLLAYLLAPVAQEQLAQLRRENAHLTRATWVVAKIDSVCHGELVLDISQLLGLFL